MRPIQLTLQAFGPFKDRVVIDFESFDDNLFLVSGDTGSGKTSIFDAMVYALYGRPSGNHRSVDDLKSDFASDADFCMVEYIFEMNHTIYHLYRAPKQRTKGKSGRIINFESEVKLEFADQVLTQTNQVKDYITQLLGLDDKQFRQIVLLPQGQFQDFLRSNGEAKETIFRELFNTNDILALEQALKYKTNQLRDEISTKSKIVENSLNRLDLNFDQQELIKHQDYQSVIEQIKAREETQKVIIAKQNEDIEKASNKLVLMKQVNQDLEQLEQYENEQKQHRLKEKTIEKQQAELRRHQQSKVAQNLQIQLNSLESKRQAWFEEEKQAQKNLLEHQKTVETIEKNLQLAKQQENELPALRQQERKINQLKVHANNFETNKKHLEQLHISEKELLNNQTSLQADIDTTNKKLTQQKQLKTELETELAQETEFLKHKEQYQIDRNNYTQDKRSFDRLTHQQKEIQKLEKTEIDHQKQAQVSLETYQQYHHRLLQQEYANIAQNLRDSVACPVCGSLDHPNPAQFKDDSISVEENKRLEAIYQADRDQLQQTRTTLANHNKAFSDDLETLGFNNLNDFEKQLLITEENLTKTNSSLTALNQALTKAKATYQQVLNTLESEQLNLQKQQRLDVQYQTQHKNIIEQKQQLQTNQANLEDILEERSLSSIEKEDSILKETINQTETFIKKSKEAQQAYVSTLTNLKHQLNLVTTRLSQNEQEQIDKKQQLAAEIEKYQLEKDVLSLRLSEEKEQELIHTIDAYQQKSIELITSINNLKHSLSSVEKYSQYIATKEAINEFEENLNQKREEQNKILLKHQKALEIVTETQAQVLEIEAETKAFQQIYMLSQLTSGSKLTDYVSFERFVLGVYFDDILISANLRFKQMTENRYELLRRLEPSKGRSKKGLDLDVFDYYTGKQRSVSSLSGGESFKAALSLALGLSDVISQRSRARSISALFVDEGFGSLDGESLDAALNTLISLKSEGKMIGIISHVEELKNRILQKITVKKTAQGSYIET